MCHTISRPREKKKKTRMTPIGGRPIIKQTNDDPYVCTCLHWSTVDRERQRDERFRLIPEKHDQFDQIDSFDVSYSASLLYLSVWDNFFSSVSSHESSTVAKMWALLIRGVSGRKR